MQLRPQPLIAVQDVEASSRFYQHPLGCRSGHGGSEYERLLFEEELVLQLHDKHAGHHYGRIGDPTQPFGNGVNPNARQRECWMRDPDGYLVVIAGLSGTADEASSNVRP